MGSLTTLIALSSLTGELRDEQQNNKQQAIPAHSDIPINLY